MHRSKTDKKCEALMDIIEKYGCEGTKPTAQIGA
jgi:hypothetical protein